MICRVCFDTGYLVKPRCRFCRDNGSRCDHVCNHNSTKRIFTADYKDSSGYMRQHLFHIATPGSIDVATTSKYAPIKSGTANGVGGGDAFNIGQQSDREQFFSWSDSTKGYYTVEWDSRINSHG